MMARPLNPHKSAISKLQFSLKHRYLHRYRRYSETRGGATTVQTYCRLKYISFRLSGALKPAIPCSTWDISRIQLTFAFRRLRTGSRAPGRGERERERENSRRAPVIDRSPGPTNVETLFLGRNRSCKCLRGPRAPMVDTSR